MSSGINQGQINILEHQNDGLKHINITYDMMLRIFSLTVTAILLSFIGCENQTIGSDRLVRGYPQIIEVIEVAPVWSAHHICRPQLITSGNLQYVAYYDDDRYLTIAQRNTNSEIWNYKVFPVQLGWATGSHAKISMVIDSDGNSQIYNARFENGEWEIVQATDWNFRWNYEGTGTLPTVVRVGNVSTGSQGTLELRVWSRYHGTELIVLDEMTLEPLSFTKIKDAPEWRKALEEPELEFIVDPNDDLLRTGGPMEVEIIEDDGEAAEPDVRYMLRLN